MENTKSCKSATHLVVVVEGLNGLKGLCVRTNGDCSHFGRRTKTRVIMELGTAEYGRHSAHFYSLLYPLCAVLCHLIAALYLCVPPCTFGFLT